MQPDEQPISFYAEVLERLQPKLLGYILAIVASPADAKDVLQESNRTIISKIGEFTHPNNFEAWTRKIAYYQSLAFLKRRQRSKLSFDTALVQTLAEEAENAGRYLDKTIAHLDDCLAKLADQSRLVINDYYYEALPIATIATKRRITANHIAQILFRARKALFDCIRNAEANAHE